MKYPSDLFIDSVLNVNGFAAGHSFSPEFLVAACARIKELEAENARLRQQRDSANAQLDFLIERGVVPKVTKSNMDEID